MNEDALPVQIHHDVHHYPKQKKFFVFDDWWKDFFGFASVEKVLKIVGYRTNDVIHSLDVSYTRY